MLEAMSAGCIVLVSETPPVQEVIKDGYKGFLVDFKSPKDIAAKACNILDNRAELSQL
jgi:glycosyltransferase involved in cell wall biosynthesis